MNFNLNFNLQNSNRRIRVIDPTSPERRMKCQECGQSTLHVYKLDPSLYFCGNCANTVPINEAKHELIVLPSVAEKETFIAQSPRRKQGRKKAQLEQQLEKKGLTVQDYIEIKPEKD